MPHWRGLLQRMQPTRRSHALDGLDLTARYLDAQNQAGVNDAAVQHNGTCPTVTVVASLFGAGHAENVSQHFQQALARLTQEVGVLTVYLCLNVNNSGHPLASPGPLDGVIKSAARQHADKVDPLADGTAHIVDWLGVGHCQL